MKPPRFANRLSRGHAVALFVTGLGLSVAIGLLGVFGVDPVARVDNAFLDAGVKMLASGQRASRTAVVDIDEVSLSAVGQWPWPRYRIASLIERIAAQKPAAIALDILFPETDRTSLASIREAFKRDFGVDVSIDGVPEGLQDNDGYLGYEIGRAGVVGSSYFYFDHVGRTGALPRPGLAFHGSVDRLSLVDATGALGNAEAISSQTGVSGFVNTRIDDDGELRRMPLLIRHDGVIHANLSLAASMHAMGVSSGAVEADADGLAIRVGSHRVPIDAAGNALLRLNGPPASYDAISAVDVLGGHLRPDALRGKVVFIGTSIVGLNDLHTTALAPNFPGLKVQAAMAENILADRFTVVPAWSPAAILAACVLVGVLVPGLAVTVTGTWGFVAGSVAAGALAVAAGAALFARAGLFVSPGAPLLAAATLLVLCFSTRLAVEKRRARLWLKQLENARQVTIESMAAVAETRDPETGAHIKRTQNYVRAIAEQLVREDRYVDVLTKEFIQLLFISAPLHDIGKVGVPDHILLKPGRLTPEEMETMKQHAEFGRQIIFSTAERIEGDNFLEIAGEIAATHHEKWDGTGYPRGLVGQAIPLSGRIMAVADIYDALISRRCYKEPFTHAHATTLMRGMRGTTFDPAVLDAFFRIEDGIKDIAARFRDETEHPPEPETEPMMAAAALERATSP